MTAQSPDLQNLLTQLASNEPPPIPSIWPLAVGYWLILLGVVLLLTFISVQYYRNRDWREIKKKFNDIKGNDSAVEQSERVHALLRAVIYNKLNMTKRLNEMEFSNYIRDLTGKPAPSWVNGHYQTQSAIPAINWQDIDQLLSQFKKEARK